MPAPKTPLSDARLVLMVHTANRAAALPFWRDVLGLRLLSENPFAAVFHLQGATLRLTDVEGWTPHPHTILGLEIADIAAAVAALRARGVDFAIYDGFGQDADGIWSAPDGRVRIAWFNDPDGNNICLTQTG